MWTSDQASQSLSTLHKPAACHSPAAVWRSSPCDVTLHVLAGPITRGGEAWSKHCKTGAGTGALARRGWGAKGRWVCDGVEKGGYRCGLRLTDELGPPRAGARLRGCACKLSACGVNKIGGERRAADSGLQRARGETKQAKGMHCAAISYRAGGVRLGQTNKR